MRFLVPLCWLNIALPALKEIASLFDKKESHMENLIHWIQTIVLAFLVENKNSVLNFKRIDQGIIHNNIFACIKYLQHHNIVQSKIFLYRNLKQAIRINNSMN